MKLRNRRLLKLKNSLKNRKKRLICRKVLAPRQVLKFVDGAFGEDLHAKRVLSIGGAATGVIHAASLGIHAIGRALAQAKGLDPKHAIKQVDRLLSNKGVNVWSLFGLWVPYIVGVRPEIVVALDWTDFDDDDQATLALNMITRHGRATPLMWLTVQKSKMKGWRNDHEDRLLQRFREVLDDSVQVTILADRGFGDTKLYVLLAELRFGYIIRFRGNILVTDAKGEQRSAADWVLSNGRARKIKDAQVTGKNVQIPSVVCAKAKGMKEPWCLAVSDGQLAAQAAIKLYARRFSIEETFRDQKDIHFGMGLSSTNIRDPARRDRLLLLSAIGIALITLLGAAGEAIGLDRRLKANTSKKRTHSLFFQGTYYYGALPNMKPEQLEPLIAKFGELIAQQHVFREVFGII